MEGLEGLLAAARSFAAKSGDEKVVAGQRLQQLVLKIPPDSVRATVRLQVDPAEYVRAVLVAARPGLAAAPLAAQDASGLMARRLAAYKASLALLGAGRQETGGSGGGDEVGAGGEGRLLEERKAAALASVLEAELGGITSAPDLTEITEKALEAFECGSPLGCVALELLPKALLLLQMAGGGEADQVGSSACTGIINRVCQYSWPLGSIGKVLAVLRDFPLSQDGLARVVAQAGQRARLADVQDLPAVVHQLLMLSTRGCRDVVLTETMRLFDHKEASVEEPNQRRQLLEVQGLAFLHMDMAVKYDAELGMAWLRQLRSDAPPRLSAFGLAISFMLAGIHRFEQPVTDALKSLVLGAYQDAAALAGAPWLPQPSSSSAAGTSLLGAAQAAALRSALLQCARNSGHNQAGIAQAIAQLASSLIEAGSGGGFGASKAGSASSAAVAAAAAAAVAAAALGGSGDPGPEAVDGNATPGQRAAALGTCLLLELFEHAGKDVRREVVALCHNRLIGAKEEVAAPYVRVLALIVRRNQATISDYFKEMQLSLEHLAFLPPNAAIALLLAVWPMCRSRRDTQDYVIMLLRKAMFSRELHARLLAARGFLYMITQELQSGSAGAPALDASEPGPSQLSMSQLGSLTGRAGGATLLHEVMSFLRRCLTQQPEVRRAVYEGMPALLAADPSVQDSVVEPLLPHFLQFYEADENLSPPLKLEACARIQGDGVRLVEPLQHLLAGVRRVLCAARTDAATADDDGCATAALRSRFGALRRRLAEGCLEDFQMDASVDFVPTTPGGLLSHAHADVLLGCLEVAMEDLVEELTGGAAAGAGAGAATQGDDGPDVEALSEALAHLFEQHQRLVDLVADRSKPGKGKKEGQGLTQATAGLRAGQGRQPGGTAAAAASGVVTVDKRVPVFSLGCLAKMLDAIADDGFKLPEMDLGTMAPDMKLCREPAFITSVLTGAQRALAACEASDLTAAIATGTAGSPEDGTAVRRLFAVPEWHRLVAPLFRAAQTVILAHCKGRVATAGAAGGPKKEKDLTEAMTQMAARALHQTLAMGAAGGVAGLAAVLELAPAPSAHAAEEAALPPVDGLGPAQSAIAGRLPLLYELFCAACKPSCAKELEQLCACLALAAGALPPALAGAVADWAVAACESLSGLAQPAAARAVLGLALRYKAGAAGVAGARGAAAGGGSQWALGDDLDLLREVAVDIKSYLDMEEMPDEAERFALLNARTHLGILAVAGQHLDSVQSALEWALGKGKALAAAARGYEGTPSAQQRAENQRRAWEKAALTRLHKAAEVLALLAEARLQGTPCEALARSLTRLYRLLGAAARAQAAPKGRKKDAPPVSAAFTDLALWANKSLTPHIYRFIEEVFGQQPDEEENEDGNEDGESDKKAKKRARANAAAASKAKRESKQVPNLIFQIEEFERHLIRLSAGGANNLMVTARRATNRDFRIKLPSADGEGGEAGGEGRSKRRRQEEAEEETATAGGEEEGEEDEGQEQEGYGEEDEEMGPGEEGEY